MQSTAYLRGATRRVIQLVSAEQSVLFDDSPDKSSAEGSDVQEHPPVNMGNPRLPPGVTDRDITRSAGITPTGHVPSEKKRDKRRDRHTRESQG